MVLLAVTNVCRKASLPSSMASCKVEYRSCCAPTPDENNRPWFCWPLRTFAGKPLCLHRWRLARWSTDLAAHQLQMKIIDHGFAGRYERLPESLSAFIDGVLQGGVQILLRAPGFDGIGPVQAHFRDLHTGEALRAQMQLTVGRA